jgi:antitoxin component of RelBE/YafQ-DinJ toxin-antitoxin module
MSQVVNARVGEEVLVRANHVIVENGLTPSAVIRGLFRHIAATNSVPNFVLDPEGELAATREHRLRCLLGAIGHASGAVDDDAALLEELEHRHA